MLVVVDEVAVGHEGQVFGVAVAARVGRNHLVSDKVGQEGSTHGGREAHVARLHRRWLQRKYLIARPLCTAGHKLNILLRLPLIPKYGSTHLNLSATAYAQKHRMHAHQVSGQQH